MLKLEIWNSTVPFNALDVLHEKIIPILKLFKSFKITNKLRRTNRQNRERTRTLPRESGTLTVSGSKTTALVYYTLNTYFISIQCIGINNVGE